jgi:SOS-response transcriptional repressor LexA
LVEAPNRRKLEILRFIASRASKGENPPSVREVGAAVGLRSSRSAHAHLERL